MQFYSTNNPDLRADLQEVIFKGLPDDNGLFMPLHIPQLAEDFIRNLSNFSFPEIAFQVAQTFLQGAVPDEALRSIIDRAINFPAPLISLDKQTYVLELTHGPSLAFKDFGARFMAEMMSYLNRDKQREIVILVATSGDTGGAVAAGFYQTPGIRVVILYPSGKVSPLQEKQLTTLGHNIIALEVNGTFDDCQALVKQAFLDRELTQRINLSSANSINMARLIPQSFYYFEAYKQLNDKVKQPIVFSIPSGNFGNLTAGLLAKKMGLPVHQFLAATNLNDVVPEYLTTGLYTPRISVRTLSNAMDVGSPSNFARMLNLYGSTWNNLKNDISGFAFDDQETEQAMREVEQKFDYTIDPHGAVGYLAWKEYQKSEPEAVGVILETAHPAKFLEDVERILKKPIEVPVRLKELENREKVATSMEPDFGEFKGWLMENF